MCAENTEKLAFWGSQKYFNDEGQRVSKNFCEDVLRNYSKTTKHLRHDAVKYVVEMCAFTLTSYFYFFLKYCVSERPHIIYIFIVFNFNVFELQQK